jgi:DHA1 family multidrug resistance protein-like MFS transporter
MLPLLPLYLKHHGGSDAVVGAVMSAFFAAQLLLQYPAGRLADRIGRVPVLLSGLMVYAVGTLAFWLVANPTVDIVLRGLQGAGAAAVSVSALALISASVPLAERGRAVNSIYAAQLAGLAIGPLIGSLAGLAHMDLVFVAASLASLAAGVPVILGGLEGWDARLRTSSAGRAAATSSSPRTRLLSDRALTGALIASAALGLVIGVYETCWTLLLNHRGAHDWQIGLSWTLFAVPFVVMARPGGWLADHFDRRWLVLGSLLSSIAFCCSYPFINSLLALLLLGGIEAVGFALVLPAAQSLLTQSVPPADHGRAQGLFGTAETGAIAVSAAAGGALFAIAPWAPFVTGGMAALSLAITLPVVWARVPGRVSSLVGGGAAAHGDGPEVGAATERSW